MNKSGKMSTISTEWAESIDREDDQETPPGAHRLKNINTTLANNNNNNNNPGTHDSTDMLARWFEGSASNEDHLIGFEKVEDKALIVLINHLSHASVPSITCQKDGQICHHYSVPNTTM